MAIGELMVEPARLRAHARRPEALQRYVEVRSTQPRFANARSIRNAIDRARLRQAARLFERTATPTREQLTTIEAAGYPAELRVRGRSGSRDDPN